MALTNVAPGWYPQGDRLRWWTGSAWSEHTAPLPRQQYATPHVPAPAAPAPVTVVVRQPRGRSVTRQRKDTSHTFHLLLTIFTGGLWGIVWACMAGWHAIGPRRRIVTRYR